MNTCKILRRLSGQFKRNASYKVLDEKDFSEKIENSTSPVIVDFCANWCKPCKAMEPRLDNVVAKHKGKISVAQVDIDNMAEVAAKYEVGSIPELVVFRNGKVDERLVGLQDEAKLGTWVDQVVGKK
ncbi:thioredoxin, mitochondrial-like [Atheta coriaria]|uniref:thioredoxin, mitochondrial-like n=1 Tax=Dalotia coriaria TaxID=877792 RepID=UPI0031F38B45